MYDFAFNAHSGLRYLILLLGVIIAVYALIGLPRKQPVDKAGMTMLRVFTILLDIQMVLGLLTLISGRWFGALVGHLIMMIAAIAVAHLGLVRLKRMEAEHRGYGLLLATALIPLALRGVRYRPHGAARLLRDNLLLYGLGGLVAPFVGIKAIDLILVALGLV